ncbi:hypothetical protein U9M48_013961, partial [Paspalum notatum var. saurae]
MDADNAGCATALPPLPCEPMVERITDVVWCLKERCGGCRFQCSSKYHALKRISYACGSKHKSGPVLGEYYEVIGLLGETSKRYLKARLDNESHEDNASRSLTIDATKSKEDDQNQLERAKSQKLTMEAAISEEHPGSACAQDCSFASVFMWPSKSNFCSPAAPMAATCSRAATMGSLFGVLAIGPKDLRSLIFRVLPKLLGLPVSLMKKFSKGGKSFHPALVELEDAVVRALPELPQDMLLDYLPLLRSLTSSELALSARPGVPPIHACATWGSTSRHHACFKSAGENVACLYSLVENRSYRLTLPDPPIRRRLLIGSSNGWLITADETCELHIVNPITGEQIALPSVSTIEQVKPITTGSGIIHKYKVSYYTGQKDGKDFGIYDLNELRKFVYFKAFMFPDPCTGSYFVVLIHNPYYQLSFARAGDDKWTWLPLNTFNRDCMYMDGILYALTVYGEIDAFDLNASTITMKVIMNKITSSITFSSHYIIWAPWGDMLQVWRDFSSLEQEFPQRQSMYTTKVTVYKADLKANELVETKSLSNHILFLGHNNSLCLRADEHPQLKANHAYFTDYRRPIDALNIVAVDLENSSRKKIASPN